MVRLGDQVHLDLNLVTLMHRFIFDPENEMFVPLEEGSMSVGPNPSPPQHIKQKHYRCTCTLHLQ